ncbi:MAG: helix-turn-helix domain-containing protein [Woeseiaceae bacterium]|nr:helix-turn-helix domain-containing protein [Woeseiaceae bacterium]
MLETVAIFVIGFSVISALVLLIAYLFFLDDMRKSWMSRVSCAVLLLALAALQHYHYVFIVAGVSLIESPTYVRLLILTPVAFFFFSRSLLLTDREIRATDSIHAIPMIAGEFLPAPVAVNLAFLVGAAYSIWFAQKVLGMREHSRRFVHERFFFMMFALLAVIVLLIGLSVPHVSLEVFHISYAFAIGVGLILVTGTLLAFPDLANDFSEVAAATYATSTLSGLDVNQLLRKLDRLMNEDKIYRDESLTLASVASLLDISPHQLSELINTRHKVGFPRFVRGFRIDEACKLLDEDPGTTILSISMDTGFQSQSSFYTAFREITGTSPGKYRRRKSLPSGSQGS